MSKVKFLVLNSPLENLKSSLEVFCKIDQLEVSEEALVVMLSNFQPFAKTYLNTTRMIINNFPQFNIIDHHSVNHNSFQIILKRKN